MSAALSNSKEEMRPVIRLLHSQRAKPAEIVTAWNNYVEAKSMSERIVLKMAGFLFAMNSKCTRRPYISKTNDNTEATDRMIIRADQRLTTDEIANKFNIRFSILYHPRVIKFSESLCSLGPRELTDLRKQISCKLKKKHLKCYKH